MWLPVRKAADSRALTRWSLLEKITEKSQMLQKRLQASQFKKKKVSTFNTKKQKYKDVEPTPSDPHPPHCPPHVASLAKYLLLPEFWSPIHTRAILGDTFSSIVVCSVSGYPESTPSRVHSVKNSGPGWHTVSAPTAIMIIGPSRTMNAGWSLAASDRKPPASSTTR